MACITKYRGKDKVNVYNKVYQKFKQQTLRIVLDAKMILKTYLFIKNISLSLQKLLQYTIYVPIHLSVYLSYLSISF